MDIMNVVVVLGKRLVNNTLTQEGHRRVEALTECLAEMDLQHTAVIFCGGVSEGQLQTEARAMFDYFKRHYPYKRAFPQHVLLEDQSTNTIENMVNAGKTLIDSELCRSGQAVKVQLVSTDYHLKRIFEIQSLMDEQGLLRLLENQCLKTGLELQIERSIDAHYPAVYPYQNVLAQVFLLLDQLTTYRVYLEGVIVGVFKRPLTQVRKRPYQIARNALGELDKIELDCESKMAVKVMAEAVEATTPQLADAEMLAQLVLLDSNLTQLNRHFDPERYVD